MLAIASGMMNDALNADPADVAMPTTEVPDPTLALPRRTFAIISHPDAGKTTLTEKLLLFGGAIHEAGMVKARRDRRNTRSDWMAIERQRGISVTSSVMTFVWQDVVFNLLDTPGHQDFSEDTYRTLTAVDAAIMVIDAARGIEAQTLKLFEVCRLRDIPIITFINKIDREGLDPFSLLDEIAGTLALDVCPLVWPIGMGGLFRGCWDITRQRLIGRQAPDGEIFAPVAVPPEQMAEMRDAVELVGAYPAFDLAAFRAGHLTPVLFGSALKDYGVVELLSLLADYAPAPTTQRAEPRPVAASDPAVTGFVFKVQANMDPNHRDRIAFTRICSGRFQRGMKLFHVRAGKTMAVQAPIFFFARDRSLAEEAYPGDIIGIPNHGVLRVGDTLTEGEALRFTGIPSFAPEILRRIVLTDPMRAKQLRRALEDLAEEGVAQIFRPVQGADWIVGVVGALQLDVLAARIDAEYKIPIRFEASPYSTARWVHCDDAKQLKAFIDANQSALGLDRDEAPVFLARDSWSLRFAAERFPEIRFAATREQVA